MNKYILLSFAFMGVAFYEMSGGADFVPRKAEIIAAGRAAEAATQAERKAHLAAAEAEATEARTIAQPLIVRLDETPAQAGQRQPEPAPQTATALPQTPATEGTPPAITLVSLEQSGVLFARPLNQLAELGPAPTRAGVVLQRNRADVRSVTGTRVNMRSGPGTNFDVLGSLTEGMRVEVLTDDGIGWVQLRTEDGQVGWMADYLLSAPAG